MKAVATGKTKQWVATALVLAAVFMVARAFLSTRRRAVAGRGGDGSRQEYGRSGRGIAGPEAALGPAGQLRGDEVRGRGKKYFPGQRPRWRSPR